MLDYGILVVDLVDLVLELFLLSFEHDLLLIYDLSIHHSLSILLKLRAMERLEFLINLVFDAVCHISC